MDSYARFEELVTEDVLLRAEVNRDSVYIVLVLSTESSSAGVLGQLEYSDEIPARLGGLQLHTMVFGKPWLATHVALRTSWQRTRGIWMSPEPIVVVHDIGLPRRVPNADRTTLQHLYAMLAAIRYQHFIARQENHRSEKLAVLREACYRLGGVVKRLDQDWVRVIGHDC